MKFKKINDLLVDVYHEGIKVGHIEKVPKGYIIEISYLRTFLTHSRKKMVVGYAKELLRRLEARKMRSLKRLGKYGTYKILD